MTSAPETGRTAEDNEAMDRFARLVIEKAEQRIRADFAEANLIALAKMYGEACGDLTYKWVCNNDGWNEAEARATAAEAEAAQLRSRLLQAEKGGEILGRDPDGSGHPAEPEPASGLGPSDGCPSRMQWQPIATAPKDGTDIIVYCGPFSDPIWGIAHWEEGRKLKVSGRELRSGWRMWHQEDLRRHSWPELWQPLPAPPALGIEAEGQDAERLDALHESPARRAMPDPLNPNQEAGDA